ncbi:ABC transporter permease [Chloroflexota bacterium]
MYAYIIRRLLLIIPTLILVTMIVFLSIRLIPGNVIELMVAERPAEGGMQAQKLDTEFLRHKLGFDVPVYVQYGRWVGGILRGDFGESLWSERPVLQYVIERAPVSIQLGGMALIIAILFALPIGIISAIRQETAGDYVGRTVAILAISLPNFWVATLVIVYPSILLNWSPALTYIRPFEDPAGNFIQFILPATIQGMLMSGTTMRMTRTMMLEVLRQDYIRTAWSKGLNERTVILRHALKNALIPVVSIIGILIPIVIAGNVIIETIFTLPGIGQLLVQAINTRDYTILSGVNVILAVFVLLVNIGVDISYAFLDPRIRYT